MASLFDLEDRSVKPYFEPLSREFCRCSSLRVLWPTTHADLTVAGRAEWARLRQQAEATPCKSSVVEDAWFMPSASGAVFVDPSHPASQPDDCTVFVDMQNVLLQGKVNGMPFRSSLVVMVDAQPDGTGWVFTVTGSRYRFISRP